MTYIRSRPRAQSTRRQAKSGLSGFVDDIISGIVGGPSAALTAKAGCGVDSSQVDGLFAKIADVGTRWNPTGTFTPQDIFNVSGDVAAMMMKASVAIQNIRASYDQDILASAQADIDKVGTQTLNYTLAAQQATATGAMVDAPGLKQYVLDAMNAALSAMVSASAVACDVPVWLTDMVSFQAGFDAVWNRVVQVAGVVASLVTKVVKVAEGAFDLVAWIEEYGPYAAVGLAAWWIFLREKRRS